MVSRKRRPSREKKINPKYWVFCEGETEEAYVGYLRSKYRLPIEIIPKVIGANINQRIVNSHKNKKLTHDKDKAFLLYDGDVPSVVERLRMIKDAEILLSTPTIELWFLLHYKSQKAEISPEECIRQLSNRNHNDYKKGYIDPKLRACLEVKSKEACKKAIALSLGSNPSTSVHLLISLLEKVKAGEK